MTKEPQNNKSVLPRFGGNSKKAGVLVVAYMFAYSIPAQATVPVDLNSWPVGWPSEKQVISEKKQTPKYPTTQRNLRIKMIDFFSKRKPRNQR